MANNEDGRASGGCLSRLVGMLVFWVILGVGVGLYFVSQPQDLKDLGDGQPAAARAASPPREIGAVLEKAIEGDYSVLLSEKELNEWLKSELVLKQGGALAPWVVLKRVWVRLREDRAEVIVEREICGRRATSSMYMQVAQMESEKGVSTEVELHGGSYHKEFPRPTKGGRFGKLVVPQGFLILVMPEYKVLAKLFEKEIELGFQRMARIKISDKQIELDPRQPARAGDLDDGTL